MYFVCCIFSIFEVKIIKSVTRLPQIVKTYLLILPICIICVLQLFYLILRVLQIRSQYVDYLMLICKLITQFSTWWRWRGNEGYKVNKQIILLFKLLPRNFFVIRIFLEHSHFHLNTWWHYTKIESKIMNIRRDVLTGMARNNNNNNDDKINVWIILFLRGHLNWKNP